MKYVVIAIALCGMFGCQNSPNEIPKEITGTIEEVRIVSKVTATDGHPVAGAVIGSMLAGNVGAVIGAAAGSSDTDGVLMTELEGCRFIVKMYDGARVAFNGYAECAVLRPRDKLYFRVADGVYIYKVSVVQHLAGQILPQ